MEERRREALEKFFFPPLPFLDTDLKESEPRVETSLLLFAAPTHPTPPPRPAALRPQIRPPSPTPPRTSAGCGEKLMLSQILGGYRALNYGGRRGSEKLSPLLPSSPPLG